MPIVEFVGQGKKVECGQYAELRRLAHLNGVRIHHGIGHVCNCLGNGVCGTCAVDVVQGAENLTPPTLLEKIRLALRILIPKGQNVRLACQAGVRGDVSVKTFGSPK